MMKKQRKKYIQSRLEAHYKYIVSLGYEVIGIFLQGSQNYNLDIYEDDYMSDVDTKCLVVPTLKDLIIGASMTSKKYDFEGEQIDVKDVRLMMEMWKKQNQSYLEILFTQYKIINPKYKSYIDNIIAMKEDIVHMNLPQLARCVSGMSKEKVDNLEHKYPATIEKINKFGYDPKQLASIIRLTHLIENLFEKNKKFEDAIIYHNGELRNYMIDVKKGKIPLEDARILAVSYDNKTRTIKDTIIEKYGEDAFNSVTYNKLRDIVYSLVRFGIVSGVLEERQNAFKELCNMIVPSDCDDAADEIIKELLVEKKENFLDYYK